MTPTGIEYEADQRHAESIPRELGLDSNIKGVASPGINMKSEDQVTEEELDLETRSWYRGVVARGITYLRNDATYNIQ